MTNEVLPPPYEKEFSVMWSPQAVKISTEHLSIVQELFFDGLLGSNLKTVIIPEGIRYVDLLPFVGKRTRVTIEVLPW